MHEMALAESVIDLVEGRLAESRVRGKDCPRVRTVRLEIGKLSGVDPEAIRFCFDAVARGTLVDGALLDIIEQDGSAWCFDCQRQVSLRARFDPCLECGGFRLRPELGTAMRVKEFEIE
jgi:hydrogenase nickel incorporation protein HypA/HybF